MPKPKFDLVLYVSGQEASRALSHVYKALQYQDYNDYQLTIVDVDADIGKVLQEGITVVPALVMNTSQSRIVCNHLEDTDELRSLFGFKCAN